MKPLIGVVTTSNHSGGAVPAARTAATGVCLGQLRVTRGLNSGQPTGKSLLGNNLPSDLPSKYTWSKLDLTNRKNIAMVETWATEILLVK
jgi:hypothetical protein